MPSQIGWFVCQSVLFTNDDSCVSNWTTPDNRFVVKSGVKYRAEAGRRQRTAEALAKIDSLT
jgi:hypothetical protein